MKSLLENHPETVWKPGDGPGRVPISKREKARLKLVLDLEFSEETGRPIFPPPQTRLSDELVYLATKFENAETRAVRYPYDFDRQGDIDPNRVPSGPPPIIWAHGLPFFPVYKGYYILCGRQHAKCIGWLLHEQDKSLMQSHPIWSVGPVVAPASAAKLQHTVNRQMMHHKPQESEKNLRYKGKAWTRDFVASEHHLYAVFPSLGSKKIKACPLWKAIGYNAHCGPPQKGTKPTVMPKEFFTNQGVTDIDYAALTKPYAIISLKDAEDSDKGTDTDSDTEIEDFVETSGDATEDGKQMEMLQSASQIDMEIELELKTDSVVECPQQVSKKDSAEDTAEVSLQQAGEDTNMDLGSASSDHKENTRVDPNFTADTKLDVSMEFEKPSKDTAEDRIPAQTDTEPALLPPTEIVAEAATLSQTTNVEVTPEQLDNKQEEVDIDLPTCQIKIHTTESVEQVKTVPGQPNSEHSFDTAICDSEGVVEQFASQGAGEADVPESQVLAG
jgi:hypothetical protein